jgi:DNA transposition AAA+ family ATPase
VVTKEYRRFAEFADAVRRERYIGLCYGPPGVGKTLSARRYAAGTWSSYPQLYSRVGFVHHFRVLSADEQAFVLARHWPELGLHDPNDFTTAEALATIIRITSGNFRLTARLVAQIRRILDINQLTVVAKEVVEAARETLVIGVR